MTFTVRPYSSYFTVTKEELMHEERLIKTSSDPRLYGTLEVCVAGTWRKYTVASRHGYHTVVRLVVRLAPPLDNGQQWFPTEITLKQDDFQAGRVRAVPDLRTTWTAEDVESTRQYGKYPARLTESQVNTLCNMALLSITAQKELDNALVALKEAKDRIKSLESSNALLTSEKYTLTSRLDNIRKELAK